MGRSAAHSDGCIQKMSRQFDVRDSVGNRTTVFSYEHFCDLFVKSGMARVSFAQVHSIMSY